MATTTVFRTRKPNIIDRIKGYFQRRKMAQHIESRRMVFSAYLDGYFTFKNRA